MRRSVAKWGLVFGIAWALAGSGEARGQSPASRGVGPGANPYSNPMTNPYMNPYLNPYMTQGTLGPDATLLYFLAAQRATGGLGSGAMSGLPSASRARRGRPAADEEGTAGSSMVPGGTAAGYFDRAPARKRPSPSRFYRKDRYFPGNGR